MTDSINANVVVSMPSQLFTMARSFKAVANGKIYIGKIDTDPVNPENQIQVYVENEDGAHVPVSQPIIINAAGYPVYNGQIAKFVTVQGHSMAVYDPYGSQQFYFPNILKYDPDQLQLRLSSPDGFKLIGQCDSFDELRSIVPEFEGQRILLKGWHSGSLLGGGEFIAKATSDLDDGGVVAGSGALKWVRSAFDITPEDFGVTPSDTDTLYGLQGAVNAASKFGVRVIITEEMVYPISDNIVVPSNVTMEWLKPSFITLTAKSTIGGVIAVLGTYSNPVDNVRFINPHIDGGNIGYPTYDVQGENGISGSKCRNVLSIGGVIRNCRRGSSSQYSSGGKAFNWEYGVDNIRIEGAKVESCSSAFEFVGRENGVGEWTTATDVHYYNCSAENCDRVIRNVREMVTPSYATDISFGSFKDIYALNCGLGSVPGKELDEGLVLLDRSADIDVELTAMNSANYGTIDSPLRVRRGYNNKINIMFNGVCRVDVNLKGPNNAQPSGELRGNHINIQHIGACTNIVDITHGDNKIIGNHISITAGTLIGNLLTDSCDAQPQIVTVTNGVSGVSVSGSLNDIFDNFNGGFPSGTSATTIGNVRINSTSFSFSNDSTRLLSSNRLRLGSYDTDKIELTNLSMKLTLPTSATGLASGECYWNNNVLTRVP